MSAEPSYYEIQNNIVVASTLPTDYQVCQWSHTANGGPDYAEIRFLGVVDSYRDLPKMIGEKITIYCCKGSPVWWGFISGMSYVCDGMRFSTSLENPRVCNSVVVTYTPPGTDADGNAFPPETSAPLEDNPSISRFGRRECIFDLGIKTQAQALAKQAAILDAVAFPVTNRQVVDDEDDCAMTMGLRGFKDILKSQLIEFDMTQFEDDPDNPDDESSTPELPASQVWQAIIDQFDGECIYGFETCNGYVVPDDPIAVTQFGTIQAYIDAIVGLNDADGGRVLCKTTPCGKIQLCPQPKVEDDLELVYDSGEIYENGIRIDLSCKILACRWIQSSCDLCISGETAGDPYFFIDTYSYDPKTGKPTIGQPDLSTILGVDLSGGE